MLGCSFPSRCRKQGEDRSCAAIADDHLGAGQDDLAHPAVRNSIGASPVVNRILKSGLRSQLGDEFTGRIPDAGCRFDHVVEAAERLLRLRSTGDLHNDVLRSCRGVHIHIDPRTLLRIVNEVSVDKFVEDVADSGFAYRAHVLSPSIRAPEAI